MEEVKVLIIEDETALADVLEAKLIKEGYDVAVAYDGEEGYEKIVEWEPTLVLLDIVMPKMDGYQVLEKLYAENRHVPIIIISNSGQPVEIERAMQLGAIDYLVKTQFDPAEVIEKVKNYLATAESGEYSSVKETTSEEATGASAKKAEEVKILLVEDDRFLRSICSQKLTKEGLQVLEAVDGENALEMLKENVPDLILLDAILPSIDGFEVLSKVRSNPDKRISSIPVIMLSNLGQDTDIDRAMKMGANDYMIKAQFTTEEIVGKIKKTLKYE